MSMLRGGPVWLLLAGVAAQDRIVGGRLVTGEQRYDKLGSRLFVTPAEAQRPNKQSL